MKRLLASFALLIISSFACLAQTDESRHELSVSYGCGTLPQAVDLIAAIGGELIGPRRLRRKALGKGESALRKNRLFRYGDRAYARTVRSIDGARRNGACVENYQSQRIPVLCLPIKRR